MDCDLAGVCVVGGDETADCGYGTGDTDYVLSVTELSLAVVIKGC